ncbi:AAA family ATPase [Streptomyces sp. NPDC002814]
MDGESLPGLAAEVRRLWAALSGETRVAVLYGPSGCGKSAVARALARKAEGTHMLPAHWMAVGRRPAHPEQLLLRLLQAMGVPQTDLREELLSDPATLVRRTAAAFRLRLASEPAVIVLDDLPGGALGEELLRTIAPLVTAAGGMLIATSQAGITMPAGGPSVVNHQVAMRYANASTERITARRALFRARNMDLLGVLAAWEGTEFSRRMGLPVEGLTRTEWYKSVDRFSGQCLLQELRPGWFEILPWVREHLLRDRDPNELHSVSRQLDSALAQRFLAGRAQPGASTELCVDLALRLGASDDPDHGAFTTWLAHQLAAGGSLSQLLMLKAGLWRTHGSWEALKLPLAVAARQTGQLMAADRVLTELGDTPEAVRELAVTRHHMGLLREAEIILDALPAGAPDGWALHSRAAIRIDRGELHDVGRLLRSAIETHQVRGDLRGEAWAVFHYGRLRLMRGDLEEARKRLDTAQFTFRDVGDRAGVVWAATELSRVALLMNGSQPQILDELKKALSVHHKHGDVRGEAWATLWLAVAYADAGRPAGKEFELATRLFKALPDVAGEGWAQHHLGALHGVTKPLADASEALIMAGCRSGDSWNRLQLLTLIGSGPHDTGHHGVSTRHHFAEIEDFAGEQWGKILRHGPGSSQGASAIWTLARYYPRHVLTGIDWTSDRLRIPHAIRHLIPEPDALARTAPPDDIPPAAARVRVTLLDDSSTIDTPVRIGLRLEPGRQHPWVAPDALLPRLTVRAVPLTRADVDPAYPVPVTGATLFRFVPHRTGRHHLRFTIEDADTGTVLQQVETDIDVTGSTSPPPRTAPHPEIAPAPARRA